MKSRWEVLAPLENRDFTRLWLANGLWWQAMWMEQLVLGWLVLNMTDSAWLVALLGFFRFIPSLFIGGISAAITDRFMRRSIILAVQLLNAVFTSLISLLFLLDLLQYWHLAAVSLAIGCGWSLDWTSRRALIPDLVGKDKVVDAMVVENSLQSLTRVTGPLTAGYLMAVLGIGSSLVALASMAFLSTILVWTLKTQSRAPNRPTGIIDTWRKQVEGVKYVRQHPRILGVVLVTIAMNMWAFPYQNLLPVFARDVLMQGPVGLGWLGAANGLGTFIGLFAINWARLRRSNEWLFCTGSIFSCVGVICFAFSTSFYLSLTLLFLAGIGHVGFSVMQSSIILVESADEMRGRAMGAISLAIGTGPLGRLQSGAMAEAFGAPLAVGSMTVMAVAAIGAAMFCAAGFVRGNASLEEGKRQQIESSAGKMAGNVDGGG